MNFFDKYKSYRKKRESYVDYLIAGITFIALGVSLVCVSILSYLIAGSDTTQPLIAAILILILGIASLVFAIHMLKKAIQMRKHN